MNLPNIITLSRIPMMFLIVGLMYCRFTGAATLAFVLFIVTAIGDWLDGYLARKRGQISNFGKFMDALTDKVLVIGIMVALVEQQMIQLVWVLIVLVREFMISGMRMMAASKGVVVAAERGGKLKTVIQLIAIGVLLFVPAVRTDVARWTDIEFDTYAESLQHLGLVLFIVATALTVSSGTSYALKYRQVFGEISK
ncbi:CDP-diacylglycerol--glycerol-3-phosphate 3-phosphatidyltransferase [Opitutaceae bacterium EW11]|nr:CDP-diacylglycerol--glycerol-3-phosphate 3-phosphatidyltransferase [Opitutaceae bacterium EW11]